MNDDPELIKKLRQAAKETEHWPDSMKKLHEIRQRADVYFSEKKRQSLQIKTSIKSGLILSMSVNRTRALLAVQLPQPDY